MTLNLEAKKILLRKIPHGLFICGVKDEDTNEVIKYITETVYEQEELAIANVTVNLDYNGAEVNATANTNITTVQYNVTVIGDNSAFNATLEAGKGNFQVTFSWHPSFGVFIEEIDGVAATAGPGLIVCLTVGLNIGKSIAAFSNKPFI